MPKQYIRCASEGEDTRLKRFSSQVALPPDGAQSNPQIAVVLVNAVSFLLSLITLQNILLSCFTP